MPRQHCCARSSTARLLNSVEIGVAARADLAAICERDPACQSPLEALLFFKGFHAIQTYRYAHTLLRQHRRALAQFLQSRSALVFGVDINPAARLGSGIMIDHGTGVVIGETAVIEDGVSMLQGVTLGGTGKEAGDRHPKIREDVMLGAGAGVFGNIEVGARAKIGAGSVVLKPVPPSCTAAGVPARLVGPCANREPAREMDQSFDQLQLTGHGSLVTAAASAPTSSPRLSRRARASAAMSAALISATRLSPRNTSPE